LPTGDPGRRQIDAVTEPTVPLVWTVVIAQGRCAGHRDADRQTENAERRLDFLVAAAPRPGHRRRWSVGGVRPPAPWHPAPRSKVVDT